MPFELQGLFIRTADVFNSEFKTIQFFKQQRFFVRESDQIQLFVMLRICLLATHFCHRAALFVGVIISNVMLYNYQNICRSFTFTAKKSTNKMPKQNLSLNYKNTRFPVCFVSVKP